MNVVVQLSAGEGTGMESDRVKFAVRIIHGKNGRESVIEASVSTTRAWLGIQCVRIGVEVNAFLRSSKAERHSGVKFHVVPFHASRVSGTVISE